MRMYDIIQAKRDKQALSQAQIAFFVEGYTSGSIPDYQAAALLMAIYLNGMDEKETAILTYCMAQSGDMVDLSALAGIKVDKHSTGGVGDKTTLIVCPIVAACGAPVAKMSGRGLGFSGGTVDKLEAIPGFQSGIDKARFFQIVRETGISLIGQSANIAPADKKMYALRDVTATVESLPLIASSIMSKKLAAGADAILLDVKTGSGAFMKTFEQSMALAKAMVSIGEENKRHTVALITDMNTPLGHAIGCSLEVIEAVDTLNGRGPADLLEVCVALAANMLLLAKKADTLREATRLAKSAIASGEAFRRLAAMVKAQGGDEGVLYDTARFPKAAYVTSVLAAQDGYIARMDSERIGTASVTLGAGRLTKADDVDFSAGIVLQCKPGAFVRAGTPLLQLHTSTKEKAQEAQKRLEGAICYSDAPPDMPPHILARVTKNGVEALCASAGSE